MKRTTDEIDRRIRGIAASAAFEDMESSPDDIEMLRRLGRGEISRADYDRHYGLVPEGSDKS